MEGTTLPLALDAAGEPADLVRAGIYGSRREAGEHGLVVLAMGLPYWLEESAEGFGVLVESAFRGAVEREFALYERDNANWPPVFVLSARRVAWPWFAPLLWAASVVWAYGAQWPDWDRAVRWGGLEGAAVWGRGEWWRLFAALWLHADLLHVLANIAIGAVVFTQVGLTRGNRRGWCELLIASLAANAATAAFHFGDGATTIGASTAVFAGIGVLTGGAVRAAGRAPRMFRWRAVFVPLCAGLALLGMLGAGDARTDVVAHALGFVAGLVVGAATRERDVSPVPSR